MVFKIRHNTVALVNLHSSINGIGISRQFTASECLSNFDRPSSLFFRNISAIENNVKLLFKLAVFGLIQNIK